MSAPVIETHQLTKCFQLRHRRPYMLRDLLRGRPRPAHTDAFYALRDVSFRIAPGETVGIIGHNGAGKSTLMTLLGGVVQPTSGSVLSRGRMGVLLEIGTGFHPDLTGRENILLNASLHGMPRHEVMRRLDAIVEFSELSAFLDMPLRSYSNGMCMRLAFSVAVQMEPEVLLVDEVLAVGDRPFQVKCRGWLKDFILSGRTLLLVSHALDTVRNHCSRALWMDQGRLRMDGAPGTVVQAYIDACAQDVPPPGSHAGG